MRLSVLHQVAIYATGRTALGLRCDDYDAADWPALVGMWFMWASMSQSSVRGCVPMSPLSRAWSYIMDRYMVMQGDGLH